MRGGRWGTVSGRRLASHFDILTNRNETKPLPSSQGETYDPSFGVHFLNKSIGIKLDIPLFKGGSFNECYLISAGL